MTETQRFHLQIAPPMAAAAGLAAIYWYLNPQHPFPATVVIAFMAGAWAVLGLLERALPGPAARESLASTAALAGMVFTLATATKLGVSLGLVGPDESRRIAGVGTGLLLAVFGNAIPKAVAPAVSRRCSAAELQAINRFSGWITVIAGLAYALAWAVLPRETATPACLAIAAGVVMLVVVRVISAKRS